MVLWVRLWGRGGFKKKRTHKNPWKNGVMPKLANRLIDIEIKSAMPSASNCIGSSIININKNK